MHILHLGFLNCVGGHNLVTRILSVYLRKKHKLTEIDLCKGSLHNGSLSLKRIKEIFLLLIKINSKCSDVDRIYFTISESFGGNLKDILIYIVLFKNLKNTTIHLHGGSIGEKIFKKYPLMKFINKFFLKEINNILVSGKSHTEIFNFVNKNKVKIVYNFAPEEMFSSQDQIEEKFKQKKDTRILYLSQMLPLKGYMDLFNAFLRISAKNKKNMRLDFAGKFYDERSKRDFLELISEYENIYYHGVVDDQKKFKLFHSAHIFCLPTRYLEGQPIAILEAYASGSAVITFEQPGISDIFTENVNGFFADKKSIDSISFKISHLHSDKNLIKQIAINNFKQAFKNHRQITYSKKVEEYITN